MIGNKDRYGQLHVMEAITASLLIFSALLIVSSINPSSDNSTSSSSSDSTIMIRNALGDLAVSGENNTRYYSELDMLLSSGNMTALITVLDSIIPEGITFNVYISNSTMAHLIYYYSTPGGNTETSGTMFHMSQTDIYDLGTGSNITLPDGIYRLVLVCWNEPRNLDDMLSAIGKAPVREEETAVAMTPPDLDISVRNNESAARPLLNRIAPMQTLAAAVVALGLGAVVYVSLSDLGKYKWASLMAPIAYSRLKEDGILDNETRKKIYTAINASPGITYSELLEEMQIGKGTLLYHLGRLEKEEYITSWRDGLYRRFTTGTRKGLEPLISHIQKKILRIVAENPGLSQSDLAKEMGESRQNIHHHVQKLVSKGLIRMEKNGKRTGIYLMET